MELAFLEGPDLIIVLVIVLVLFGGSRLPGLARSLGEAQRELRKGQQEDPAAPAANSKPDEPGPTSP
ncbi:MAG TPA: twin-arginine translocase TatA/TatE family subunit [Acidimicrobiales bacterium]|jgi:sec-independent protein translocase protein TatA